MKAQEKLTIRLLGAVSVHAADGRDLTPPGRKLRALLACLALSNGNGLSRERLAALLWGDRDDEQARASLRQALAELRKLLGDPSPLRSDRETIELDPALATIDVVEFERLAAAGAYEAAAAFYQGDLLDGQSPSEPEFAAWIAPERTHLRDLAIDVLTNLADAQDGEAAIATAQRIVEIDPLREESHRVLMRFYTACGQRDRALRQYQTCRDVLRRELDVAPAPETELLLKHIQSLTNGAGPAIPLPGRRRTANAAGTTRSRRLTLPLLKSSVRTWHLVLIGGLIFFAGAVGWQSYSTMSSRSGFPSLVVLPFSNLSGNPALDYFSDGVTEDITMALSTFPEIRVVARTSAGAYKGKVVNVQDVARDLGAQYVLEGSTQSSEGKARITAQLIDATTGSNVWASRFDEEGDNITALQDAVAARVFNALAGFKGEIRKSEERVAWDKSGIDLGEYDYYLRGHQIFFRYTEQDMAEARRIWREGLSKFPNSALLRIKIAVSYLQDVNWGWSDDPDRDLDAGWKLLEEAAAISNRPRLVEWYLHYIRAQFVQWYGYDFDRSVAEAKAAVAIMPYDAWSLADLAGYLAQAGKTQEAIAWAEEAINRDPHPPDWYIANLGWAYYLSGDYAGALKTLQRLSDPHNLCLVATLVRLGRLEEARELTTQYAERYPDDTLELWRRWPIRDASVKQGYLDDLRQAGLPDRRQ